MQPHGFSPAQLSPAVWCDGDVGSPANWTDLSGSGNAPLQASGPSQPTITANAINGHKGFLFDGVNDFMQVASLVIPQPFTLALVFKSLVIGATGVHDTIICGDATGAFSGSILSDTTPQFYMFCGSADPIVTSLQANGVYARMVLIYNGASSSMRIGGVQVDTGNPGATGMSRLTIAGGNTGTSRNTNIELASLIVAPSALAGANLAALEAWQANRYAL